MTDKELFALEMDLLHAINSKKISVWHKLLAVFELNAIAEHH